MQIDKKIASLLERRINWRQFASRLGDEIDNCLVVILVVAVAIQLLLHERCDIFLSLQPAGRNYGCSSRRLQKFWRLSLDAFFKHCVQICV